jgi:putative flippase GtrA
MRFVLNGCLAAAIHYVVYCCCQFFLEVNVSYAIGYVVSFVVNYFTTTYFTFRKRPSWKHFIGFCGSHGVNILLHTSLFWCMMQLGVNRFIAPFIVMGIAMLVQFTILRMVFKK